MVPTPNQTHLGIRRFKTQMEKLPSTNPIEIDSMLDHLSGHLGRIQRISRQVLFGIGEVNRMKCKMEGT